MSRITCAAGDATDLRAAIAAAGIGDVVEVPAGTYALAAGGAIPLTRSLELDAESGAILDTGAAVIEAFKIDATGQPNLTIDRLIIDGFTLQSDGIHGVAGVRLVSVPGAIINDLEIRNCRATGFTNGFKLDATGMTMLAPLLRRLRADANLSAGIAVVNAPSLAIEWCRASGNNVAQGSSPTADANVLIDSCPGFIVNGLGLEAFVATLAGATRTGVAVARCLTGTLNGLRIQPSLVALVPRSIGVNLIAGCRGVRVEPFPHSFCELLVYPADLSSAPVEQGPNDFLRLP